MRTQTYFRLSLVSAENKRVPHPHLASSAPMLYRSSIQDGGIANFIYYLAFRSKITPVLQASNNQKHVCAHRLHVGGKKLEHLP